MVSAVPGFGIGATALKLTRKASLGRSGKITGYTKHGLNQAVGRNGGRGVSAKHMLDAVKITMRNRPQLKS